VNENETIQVPTGTPTVEPARVSAPVSPFAIMGPDAETVFIDVACRAWRLEDLPPDVRRDVEAAVARAVDPEVLPSNEALAAASRALSRHVRDLPPDRRMALVVDAARAIDTFESPVHEFRLERYRQDVRRLTEANKDLFSLAEGAVDTLTTSVEFSRQCWSDLVRVLSMAGLTPKGRTWR
jgi:hypothetical protein